MTIPLPDGLVLFVIVSNIGGVVKAVVVRVRNEN
jgi:hypothetical protein